MQKLLLIFIMMATWMVVSCGTTSQVKENGCYGFWEYNRWGMKRGTIVIKDQKILAPHFNYNGTNKYIFLKIMDNLLVTSTAAKKIIELSKKKEKKMLRISVTGGGCQGFSYNLDMENEFKKKDIVIKKNNAVIVIDQNSLNLIKGSEIDFVEDLIGSRFKINNPKATSSCGCGTSFSL